MHFRPVYPVITAWTLLALEATGCNQYTQDSSRLSPKRSGRRPPPNSGGRNPAPKPPPRAVEIDSNETDADSVNRFSSSVVVTATLINSRLDSDPGNVLVGVPVATASEVRVVKASVFTNYELMHQLIIARDAETNPEITGRRPRLDQPLMRAQTNERSEFEEFVVYDQVSDGNEDKSNVLTVLRRHRSGVLVPGDRTMYNRPAVIKYRSNCGATKSENVLIKNYILMFLLGQTGITVNPITLSPPAVVKATDVSLRGLAFPGGVSACIGSKLGFLVMERFGRSLRSWIRQHGPLNRLQAFQIGRKVLENIEKLHSLGIVHGDISWSNILVTEDLSDVRLIDFDNSVFDCHRDKYIPSPIEAGVRSSLPPSQWVTRDSSKLSFRDDLFMLRLMVNDVIQQGDAGICRLRVLTSKEWESKTKPTSRGWLSRSPSEFFPEKYNDFTEIYSHIDKIITEESND